ncbi:exodeoxyribonuclease V subunit gamma [Leptospira tipperaryensis]|uniref:Exodeoxyribonuclease V subunit gamma n=1 Tax=Leptospira tipperaryensis TaxID=2564040 RepID=A0A1D7UU09_9LEPT|nr:exodeoxyribonuclease V subunit gamma [Leptospira tipperaryensis]AOP33090.1 exodeoxyribonuclease V subunit gamma [Leptospira tipperaryensis]
MSVTHITSLSLEDIAVELSKNILAERKVAPLHAPVIVIPSTNMKLWLNLNLSRINGLTANLRFQFLEKTLEEFYLRRAGFDFDPFHRTFPSQEANQRKILTFLIENRDQKEIRFLNSFLQSIPRAFSLSSKLTSLIKDYELNRSSWISSWAKEKGIEIPSISHRPSPFPKEDEYYLFQKELYQKVFLNPKEPSTLVQFLLKEAQKNPNHSPKEFPSLHLFCLSNLSDTYLGILESLSKRDRLPIYLYQFHTGANRNHKDSFGPRSWSNPQIHIAARMEKIEGNTSTHLETSHTFPPKLDALRTLLDGKQNTREQIGIASDTSVRFWNAPSAYREMEAVANDILYKMNLNSKLTYLDFAILVTDMKTYRPTVEWVLDGGILLQSSQNEKAVDPFPVRKKIPYSLTDIKANDASLLYRGLINVWEICSSPTIEKNSLLRLLRNPLLQTKLRIHPQSILDLENLIDSTGMIYEEEGRENDSFQISNGMRRIRLSSILSKETAWTKYKIPPIDLESEENSFYLTQLWETILRTKRNVLSIFKNKTNQWNPEYFRILRNSLEELFEFSEEYEQEAKLFFGWLESLNEWDGIRLQNEKDGVALLKFITEQTFDQIPYRKGAYLTGGVTISLLQPMRPIPFKHIYILGLGEGKFPGNNDRSQLNLRKDLREEWDISRREIQESLLWETIHSAKESLTLSYVGKNLQEDKTFEPCSHLFEIMESFGVQEAIKLPLHSYSIKYKHTQEEMAQGLVSFDFARTWVNGDRRGQKLFDRFQNLDDLKKVSTDFPVNEIDLREISQFLSDPLDTYLKKKLGMYLDEEEPADAEGEPFDLDAIAEANILKKMHAVMMPSLVSKEPWSWNEETISSALIPILEKEKQSARFPQSVFGKIQEADLLGYLKLTSELLAGWKPLFQGGRYYSYLSLGDTGLPEDLCKKIPELTVSLQSGKNVKIKGEWEHVVEKDGVLYWLFPKSLEDKPSENFYGYKDYWKVMSFPFLTGVAFSTLGENFKIYSFKARPSEDAKKKNFLPIQYLPEESALGQEYFQKIAELYLQEKPVFFPRKAFLSYYVKNIQGSSGKKTTPDNVAKFDDENAWKNYLKEELDSVRESLSSLVKLYRQTPDLILRSSIHWAKDFYKPFLDWKKDL